MDPTGTRPPTLPLRCRTLTSPTMKKLVYQKLSIRKIEKIQIDWHQDRSNIFGLVLFPFCSCERLLSSYLDNCSQNSRPNKLKKFKIRIILCILVVWLIVSHRQSCESLWLWSIFPLCNLSCYCHKFFRPPTHLSPISHWSFLMDEKAPPVRGPQRAHSTYILSYWLVNYDASLRQTFRIYASVKILLAKQF